MGKIVTSRFVFYMLNEPIKNITLGKGCSDVADIPENELQHDVFTVQGEQGPEEAQRHHAELQHRHIRKVVGKRSLFKGQYLHDCQFIEFILCLVFIGFK